MICTEGTPSPEQLKEWYDELYADLPDLPDALENCLQWKYNFRIGVRENNNVPMTYLDQDKSGTFDPACKRPPESIPINKKKRERRERVDDGTPRKVKSNTWLGGRWKGCQLPVVLKITSEKGRTALKDFGASSDNWPEHSLDPDSSDESRTEWSESQAQPYELRDRRRCHLSDSAIGAADNDLHLEDVTLGYPAYRGCKGCFKWGFRCPLLDEGSSYPCAECAAANTECELIVEPALKRTCEGCRSRRQQCSYREKGEEHIKPCQQCSNASRKCLAGPASGRTRTGPSLDQGAFLPGTRFRKKPSPPRKQDAQAGRSDFSCAGDLAECSHYNNGGTTYTVAPLKPQSTMSDKGKQKEQATYRHKQSKPTAAQLSKSNRCRTIATKLAHPIHFKFAYDDEDDEGTAQCHWCEDAIYGILGLGKIEVEILDHEDGQGFIETVDGHAQRYGQSRMCESCTTGRLKITACKNHEIEPIKSMDPQNFDEKVVREWMTPSMASLAPFAWCSICPKAALFCCSTKPDNDMDGQDEDLYLEDQKGCGLLLCRSCAVSLFSEHEGKLDRLIESLGDNGANGRFGIRADASFLHSKGELLQRTESSCNTFFKNTVTHYDDVALSHPSEVRENPAITVDKMGELMTVNGNWDNKDDDEPGMFKKED